jgi:histidinol-phosphate phosphatase family protein
MKNRILITGYPGWLTRRFLETLSGYSPDFASIRCLIHPDHKTPVAGQGPWEYVSGDLNDPSSLREAVRDCDIILHAAGIIHVKKVSDFYKINRDGTRNLLEAAVAASVEKFIFISSNAAQGFCEGKGHELDETAPCRPESHYGKSKRQAEEVVEKYSRAGKIKTVILRPAMFYGPPVPERHLDIYKRVQRGKFPVFGTGDYMRSITYIDHLVQAIHLAIQKPEAEGKTFAIIDREIPTLNEILQAMGDALGVSVRIRRFPKWMAQAADLLDRVIEAAGFYWMLPHIVGESCRHIAYKIDRAERELGYVPQLNYREGYKKAIDWCFEKGLLKRNPGKKKAVFFDRDGVLVRTKVENGKVVTPSSLEEFEVEPRARELVALLRAKGFLIFVVTNQPDIARKKISSQVLEQMHERLCEYLGGPGILNHIYVCPHDDPDGCDCRKPRPGMLLKAASEWGLDLGRSFMIGDHAKDMEAAKAAGCKALLIRRKYNEKVKDGEVACDLEEAVHKVIALDEACSQKVL